MYNQLSVSLQTRGAPGVGAIFKMYLDLDYVNAILSNYDPAVICKI